MFELPEEDGDVVDEEEDSSLVLADWACEPEATGAFDGGLAVVVPDCTWSADKNRANVLRLVLVAADWLFVLLLLLFWLLLLVWVLPPLPPPLLLLMFKDIGLVRSNIARLLLEEVACLIEDSENDVDDGAEGEKDDVTVELAAAEVAAVVVVALAGIEVALVVVTLLAAPEFLVSVRLVLRRFEDQIRTVVSSEALASMWWYRGFHETQFTVLVCPFSTEIGCSRFKCQT